MLEAAQAAEAAAALTAALNGVSFSSNVTRPLIKAPVKGEPQVANLLL